MHLFMRKLNTIVRCGSIYRAEQLQNEELGGHYHSFVLAISKNPGLSQDQLAQRLCFNKSTVARSLAHLEAHGYVTRTSSASDRRVTVVYPTDKMLAVYPSSREIAVEWNRLLAEGIEEEHIKIFMSVLDRMDVRAKELVADGNGGQRE